MAENYWKYTLVLLEMKESTDSQGFFQRRDFQQGLSIYNVVGTFVRLTDSVYNIMNLLLGMVIY